ncbi:hypothetical protein GJ744_010539 [Endocarpon pusillum]|uniref:Uncharacterized protein n=1 Tax=Endocarpon pusillum TaxID=364733 RepID=A0A8H7APX8_9EURO|nr:hypothetical protein GJ744_010539 [Endocarpon pusillum]
MVILARPTARCWLLLKEDYSPEMEDSANVIVFVSSMATSNWLRTLLLSTNWLDAYKNGQVREAVELVQEVVKDSGAVTGGDSFRSTSVAACTGWSIQGEWASERGRDIGAGGDEDSGASHWRRINPNQLASQHQLAICMWELGNHKISLFVLRIMARIVELQKKVLDEKSS